MNQTYKPILIPLTILISVGFIFLYQYDSTSKTNNQQVTFDLTVTTTLQPDNSIGIQKLTIPKFSLNKEHVMNVNVKESFLCPSKSIITCNTITGTIIKQEKTFGTFTTPHMIINQKTKSFVMPMPTKSCMLGINIESDQIHYDAIKKQAEINNITISIPALCTIRANRAHMNLQEEIFTMNDNVTSTFFIQRDKQPQP